MASALKKLTGMGGDVRKIARLLQAKAPEGHMLAYITPEEASVLKQRGGRGRPHADTGIPSFQEEDFQVEGPPISAAEIEGPPISAAEIEGPPISTMPEAPIRGDTDVSLGPDFANQYFQYFQEKPQADERAAFQAAGIPTTTPELQTLAGRLGPTGEAPKPTPEPSAMDSLSKSTGLSKDTLARLGVAGVSALLGRGQTAAAREGAQQGRQEIEAVAAPYRQQGLQLQAQAQRGELTPQAQQSLQAVQAQAAQQAQRRGGVGVAQSQQQIENFRQQLLAQQYDLGLKISGIGDQIALGAIRTGMQADQYVNQLTGSYYGNIARSLYGAAPQAQQPGVA